jgi:hypothetical protein
MSGRILGDRGECARCRNGVCLLNDVPAVLVRKIFEVFLRASLCGGRVTDACRWCSKYGHVAPALPKWARLAFVKRQFESGPIPFGVRCAPMCLLLPSGDLDAVCFAVGQCSSSGAPLRVSVYT